MYGKYTIWAQVGAWGLLFSKSGIGPRQEKYGSKVKAWKRKDRENFMLHITAHALIRAQ
jgi:hypothetical protein